MPQLNQLSLVALSQFFWLLIGLSFVYFVVARAMVPKIQATVDAREEAITGELAAAQRAREGAEKTQGAYSERMNAGRAKAAQLTQDAKQESARATDARVRAASEQINAKVEAAEAQVRAAAEAAKAEIEAVAAEAAQEMVSRLSGLSIARADAAKAVKAVMSNG
jgi:F-type H+-transporting ATPase subunit b